MPENESENPTAPESPLTEAAAANDPQAALLAVSTSAAPGDAKKAVIYNCIVAVFFDQGFPEINDQSARIVWSTIDDMVVVALGNGIANCITGKGFHCPALAPVFATLKEMNQVTVVSDLVTGLAALVTP
jgi:TctA family transporter